MDRSLVWPDRFHEPPVVTCGRYERVLIRKFSPHYSLSLTKMPPKSRDIEERMAKASIAINEDSRLKGIKAASQFGAPYNRLMACRRGRPASYTRGGTNKKLSEPEDKALKKYILIMVGILPLLVTWRGQVTTGRPYVRFHIYSPLSFLVLRKPTNKPTFTL